MDAGENMGKPFRIAATLGFLFGIVATVKRVMAGGDWQDKAGRACEAICGFNFVHDMVWRPQTMTFTLPAAAGVGVSAAAAKLGANKYVPFKRIAF
jgi:hypothetical protein